MLTCQQVWEEHRFIFEFDKAYNHQLIEKFEASPVLALTEKVAPPETGVYALYWKGEMVYAGKALKTTLKRRLAEHNQRIRCRLNLRIEDIKCRFLLIDGSWLVRAAEDALITHYTPVWNQSGFGRHVPGSGRPGKHPCKWEVDFPFNPEYIRPSMSRSKSKRSPPQR